MQSNFRAFVLVEKLASKNDQIFSKVCIRGKALVTFIGDGLQQYFQTSCFDPSYASVYLRWRKHCPIMDDELEDHSSACKTIKLVYLNYIKKEDLGPFFSRTSMSASLCIREAFESGHGESFILIYKIASCEGDLRNYLCAIEEALYSDSQFLKDLVIKFIGLMEPAFEKGEVEDPFLLAYQLSRVEDEESLVKARKYYKISMDKCANEYARGVYVKMLYYGEGGSKDIQLAKNIAEAGVQEDDFLCDFFLFLIYKEEKNLEKAREFCKKAIDTGSHNLVVGEGDVIHCLLSYYNMCRNGVGGAEDLFEAYIAAKEAYNKGSVSAIYGYARALYLGEGCRKDLVAARRLYLESAEQHKESRAMLSYANMCLEGSGGEKDYEEALKWAEKALEHGCLSSYQLLAYLYLNGLGVTKDFVKVRKFFYESIASTESFNKENAYAYALMCFNGDGGDKDLKEAEKWVKSAAEKDYTPAYGLLADVLLEGAQSSQDYKDAVNALEKAYEKCSRKEKKWAQFKLLMMQTEGQGMPKNVDGALGKLKELAQGPDLYWGYKYAKTLFLLKKETLTIKQIQEIDICLYKAVRANLPKALLVRHQFSVYQKQRLNELALDPEAEIIEPSDELTVIDLPDLELEPSSDDSDSGDSDEGESDDEALDVQDNTDAADGDDTDLISSLENQWAVDKKRKKSRKYDQWCRQSMSVTQKHLEDSCALDDGIRGMEFEKFTIPAKLDIGLLDAVFGLNGAKFTNYRPLDAMQLFEKFGCNVGENAESFHIEYKDKDGIIHRFSSHKSHGHGKENKLYRPTNLYLERFCNTIGLTKKIVESYQG